MKLVSIIAGDINDANNYIRGAQQAEKIINYESKKNYKSSKSKVAKCYSIKRR